MKINITNMKIEPCCANQNPRGNPPKKIELRSSANKIPNPKDEINQMVKRIFKYKIFFFQYFSFILFSIADKFNTIT